MDVAFKRVVRLDESLCVQIKYGVFMMRELCVAVVLLCMGVAWSAPVADDVVERMARSFAGQCAVLRERSLVSIERLGEDRLVRFAPSGAMICSADDEFAPVRFFTGGSLDVDNLGEGLSSLLARDRVADVAHRARWGALLNPAPVLMGVGAGSVQVGPLVPVHWSQENHYNRMAPLRDDGGAGNDGRKVTGCVATAMAQLLAYYEWPPRGRDKMIQDQWSQYTDFDADYDWDHMLQNYLHYVSGRESLAVAQVMADCGAVLNMNFGDASSGADTSDIYVHLHKHFYYRGGRSQLSSRYEDLGKAVSDSLDRGAPVVLAGSATMPGRDARHAYLLDGYMDVAGERQYHLNFGWGGAGDVWGPLAEAGGYKQDHCTVDVTPEPIPLFKRMPAVAGLGDFTLAWDFPKYYADAVKHFTVEVARAEKRAQVIPLDVSTMAGVGKFGVSIVDGVPTYQTTKPMWGGGADYPMATAYFTEPISVRAGNQLVVKYEMVDLKNGTKAFVVPVDANGEYGWDDNWNPISLTVLPNGTGESLEAKTYVYDFKQSIPELRFGFYVYNSNGDQAPYAVGKTLLRIKEVSVNGQMVEWQPVQTQEVGATTREAVMAGVAAGEYRYAVTAHLSRAPEAGDELSQVATHYVEHLANPAAVMPTIGEPVMTASGVTLPVTAGHAWTYAWRGQNDAVRQATKAKRNNQVVITFKNPTLVGTYWGALDVADSVTGHTATRYVVFNPPMGTQPMPTHVAHSYEEAVAMSRETGKPILGVTIQRLNNSVPYSQFLSVVADGSVQKAMDRYVVWEIYTGSDAGYAWLEKYWQPTRFGEFMNGMQVHFFLIDTLNPEVAAAQYHNPTTYSENWQAPITTLLNGPLPAVYPSWVAAAGQTEAYYGKLKAWERTYPQVDLSQDYALHFLMGVAPSQTPPTLTIRDLTHKADGSVVPVIANGETINGRVSLWQSYDLKRWERIDGGQAKARFIKATVGW